MIGLPRQGRLVMADGRFFVSRGGLSPALRRRGDGERTQFRATTRIIATRGVKEYRETIPAVVGPDDLVLEVGCEWGTTTAVLAQYAAHVIGTDISPKCVGRARAMRPGLDFRVLDAFDV